MPLRKQKPPPRRPHPLAETELKLRRILDLRASIDRRTRLISDYRSAIYDFHEEARETGDQELIAAYHKRADELDDKIRVLETGIEQTGKQIADLQAGISPDDLAYLW